jgi:class 3 adenylate cyclase/DNA-binding winged helix-turn-helix (wHTH) protein/tetratricopeptide (TPR) repeat protein
MDAEKLSCHTYRFDRFILDLNRGALLALDGTEIPLRPKSFALLQLLLDNAGRLLKRDTIMEAVWPDVFVTDDSITQCVGDIRRALGDEAQRLLRIVPRRGYLFATEVSRIEPIRGSFREEPQAFVDQPAAPSWNGAAQDRHNDSKKPIVHLDPEAAPDLTGLGRQQPSPESERRHLTVLACDLVNSTGFFERMDPEDESAIMHAFMQRCTAVITGCGGHIATYTGDGMVAYFGYPHAHEDAAEQSVRVGLALVEAAATLETGPDLALQLRVGIATGLVVNDRIGDGAQGCLAVGRPLNLAARLQALARPATVLIADTTRCLLGGLFDFEDLGCHALKGFTAPVRAWRVIGEGTAESRFEALRGASLTPLVGRGHELSLLLDRWRQARAGEGQVVLLAGEPGIGKSRLIQALRDRLAGEPHTYLGYSCSPFYQDSPLWPVIAQLERAASLARSDDPAQRLVKLETLLAQGSENIARIAPLITSLLSIPSDGRYPPLDMSPQLQRERTLAALVDQLAGLTAHRPVLLIWEDAHWADPTSLELLELAIDRLQNLPVLALVTFRPEFAPTWPGHTHITRLTLNRLNRRCCSQLVAGLTGGKSLPAVVLDQIVAKAEGVPLFVEELTKMVLEAGLLREEDSGYELKGLLPPAEIPATLQDSLMARLDRLAPAAKEIAQVAAVIGREFSSELLAAVVSWEEKDLNAALRRLVAAELIFPRGVRSEATYVFKHALVRDAAYATLLRTKREELHGHVAQVLEDFFPDVVEAHPEVLAHHCAQAGMVEKAVGYWSKAGRQAIARSAMAEAASHLHRALELLPALPDTPARWRCELNLQTALGTALAATKGYSALETGRAYEWASVLCERLGDTPRLVQIASGQCMYYLHRCETDAAFAFAERLLRRAKRERSIEARLAAHRLIGTILVHTGHLRQARRNLEVTASILDGAGGGILDGAGEDTAQMIVCQRRIPFFHAILLLLLGRYDQARMQMALAIAETRKLKHPHVMAVILAYATWFHLSLDEDVPHYLIDAFGELAAEHGSPYWVAEEPLHRGLALVRAGEIREGIALVREATAHYDALGGTGQALTALCLASRLAGGVEGRALVDEASALVEPGVRVLDAEIYRIRGALLADGGDVAAAEAQFTKAIGIARAQGAKHWELRAATSLARLWRDQGRCTEAHDLLAPVYGWFNEGQGTPDLMRAKALLYQLGS